VIFRLAGHRRQKHCTEEAQKFNPGSRFVAGNRIYNV
jgi:hypothetical protein